MEQILIDRVNFPTKFQLESSYAWQLIDVEHYKIKIVVIALLSPFNNLPYEKVIWPIVTMLER